MRRILLKTTVRAQAAGQRVHTHLEEVRRHAREDGERGEAPIPTVIIVIAGLTGALLIAGILAAVHAKFGSQLRGA